MRQLSGSNRRVFSSVKSARFAVATAFALSTTFVYAEETTPASVPAQSSEPSTASISREVKEIFEKSGKAVVKIRGTDEHGDLSGTGFFIDPTVRLSVSPPTE